MSCCPEQLWSDGYIGSKQPTVSTNPWTLYHWKVEWHSVAGDRGGWFIYSSAWSPGSKPINYNTSAGGAYDHYDESPWYEGMLVALRQAAGICSGEVPFSVVQVYPVEATFPTVYSPP